MTCIETYNERMLYHAEITAGDFGDGNKKEEEFEANSTTRAKWITVRSVMLCVVRVLI